MSRRFLVVLAHPLPQSFAASAARAVVETLEAKGHQVYLLDLYAEDFDPRLSAAERAAYMEPGYAPPEDVSGIVARLKAADGLVLVFPQWWFNLPAIMKGFIDRIFVPGVAFEHDKAGGRIVPLMTHIKSFWIVIRCREGNKSLVAFVHGASLNRDIFDHFARHGDRCVVAKNFFIGCLPQHVIVINRN